MARPFYFTIQSWMLEDMHLTLSEAAVYAYIYGLTNSVALGKQGWRGSIRNLAKVLNTPSSTMNDIVKRLNKRGCVRIINGHILSNINRDPVPGSPNERNPDINLPPSGDDEVI